MTTDWTPKTGPRTLRCPFCGRQFARAFPTDERLGCVVLYAVLCRGCGAEGPPAPVVEPPLLNTHAPPELREPYRRALRELAAGEAIRAWNERPHAEGNIVEYTKSFGDVATELSVAREARSQERDTPRKR